MLTKRMIKYARSSKTKMRNVKRKPLKARVMSNIEKNWWGREALTINIGRSMKDA